MNRESVPNGALFSTVLCPLLGVEYPIIQGALGGGMGGPVLAAAVSNAGGLGVLPSWGMSLDKLRATIRQTRVLTDRPFAVNIMPIGPAFARTRAELVVDEGVPVLTTGRSDPRQPLVSFAKRHGVKVIGVVPSVRLALRLEAEGADVVVASGQEAGGHVGKISSLPLIPQVVDAVKIPVVAAGGIADARGFLAALALGACGIQMGTRFVATVESEASIEKKERVLASYGEDTLVTTLFTGKTMRVLRGPELDRVHEAIENGTPKAALHTEIADLRRKRYGDYPDFTIFPLGQAAGLVKGILPAAAVIQTIILEAERLAQDRFGARGV